MRLGRWQMTLQKLQLPHATPTLAYYPAHGDNTLDNTYSQLELLVSYQMSTSSHTLKT